MTFSEKVITRDAKLIQDDWNFQNYLC